MAESVLPAEAQIGRIPAISNNSGEFGSKPVQTNASSLSDPAGADFSLPNKDCMHASNFLLLGCQPQGNDSQVRLLQRDPSQIRLGKNADVDGSQKDQGSPTPLGPSSLNSDFVGQPGFRPSDLSSNRGPEECIGLEQSLEKLDARGSASDGPSFPGIAGISSNRTEPHLVEVEVIESPEAQFVGKKLQRYQHQRRKRTGGELSLKMGSNRFLQKIQRKNKKFPSKIQGRNKDGGSTLGTQSSEKEGFCDGRPGRNGSADKEEGNRVLFNQTNLDEGSKIWDFGKAIGLSSNLGDLEMAKQLTEKSGVKRAEEYGEIVA